MSGNSSFTSPRLTRGCERRCLYPFKIAAPLLRPTHGVTHSAHTLSHTAMMPYTAIRLLQCWECDCHCL